MSVLKCNSLILSHSYSFTLSFTRSRHAEQLLFSCLCSKVTVSHSHILTLSLSHCHCHSHTLSISHSLIHICSKLTLTLSHSHTLSISHSLTLDMLNNFCFHVYAQKSLFIGENCNGFFYLLLSSTTLSCDLRVHRAGSQLKT